MFLYNYNLIEPFTWNVVILNITNKYVLPKTVLYLCKLMKEHDKKTYSNSNIDDRLSNVRILIYI